MQHKQADDKKIITVTRAMPRIIILIILASGVVCTMMMLLFSICATQKKKIKFFYIADGFKLYVLQDMRL
jgi:hypothetical protein